jgi:hypothetical protein
MGRSSRSILAFAALAALALPAGVSAGSAAVPGAAWTAPTPPEGKRFTVDVGKQLTFSAAATAPGAPVITVAINAAGLPRNALFQFTLGNPAKAAVGWTPTRA